MFEDLKNKIILVTGGYGYLGTTFCKTLNGLGARVYCAGRDKSKFEKALSNSGVIFLEMDVSKSESVKSGLATIDEKEGKIDVLINNAYFGKGNHPENLTPDEWRIGIEGGLNQCYDLLHLSIPFLKKSKSGRIINIASMYGVTVPSLDIYDGREQFLNPPNYGVAKAGLVHLTKYYAMFLSKYNITVNAISPGPFPSEEVQKDAAFIERLKGKTKLNRIGKPEDLEGIIALLSSSKSSFITGQNISVDGGWTI